MDRWSSFGLGTERKALSHKSKLSPTPIVPYGPYGGGQFTGHPIGSVIAVGFIAIALIGIPEARWFFAGSLVLGTVFGTILWLLHRSKSLF